ncbi:MAG: hypothetical protein HC889_00665 [Synechococcaceae cyanobacterium SM1_2_3]|nr:hypothetical protein [Synechococcaceae cyanobacterium SM1_2_3]
MSAQVQYATIGSGQNVSNAIALRGASEVAAFIPALNATPLSTMVVRPEAAAFFGQGAASAQFLPVQKTMAAVRCKWSRPVHAPSCLARICADLMRFAFSCRH